MKIKIIKGDITKLEVDAIVNAANASLLGGGGVDGAIHMAAGKQLLEECRTLNGCKTGEAKITKGYNLPAKYVIHTVGPIYGKPKRPIMKEPEKHDIRTVGSDGDNESAALLYKCYENSLLLAKENNINTIAFPCISTGIYGYPFEEACIVALNAISDFMKKNECFDEIILVCFSENDYLSYTKIFERGGYQ
jgi:O-acetyl-ADP-ribose deacetylase (regulator of RNase III)